VMLVLLIIFMVAAPLATVDVAVDLPASTAQPQERPDKPVFLTAEGGPVAGARQTSTVPRDGARRLPSTRSRAATRTASSASSCARTGPSAYRRADGGHESSCGQAGYLKVALVGLEDTGQGAAQGAGKP
jgi:biopolymer transport protein ExbD